MAAVPKLFNNIGEQLAAIACVALEPNTRDERLLEVNAAITGAGTMPLSDGGFLIHGDFSSQIFEESTMAGQLSRLCQRFPLRDGAKSLTIPTIIDSSRANGSRLEMT